jgi:hypothetical protein
MAELHCEEIDKVRHSQGAVATGRQQGMRPANKFQFHINIAQHHPNIIRTSSSGKK